MSRQGKPRERTLENVKDFWNKEAQEWGDDPRVTIRDHYFRLREVEVITEVLKGRRKVLDIGCGSGFSTLFYSQVVEEIIGADYAELMVERAQRFLNDPVYLEQIMERYALDGKPALRGNIRFENGDILNIGYPNASFDAVVAERVLINLPSRDLQDGAVGEVARVLKAGGICALVEVTQQGHQYVDRLRQMFGLSILEKYWHNLYIDESHFEALLDATDFLVREVKRFETYQFLTKVIHPLIVAPEEPRFLAGYNNAARIVSRDYPTYQSVIEIGLERFFQEVFRPLLLLYDPAKLVGYDRVIQEVLHANPDFTGCSHQVLYVLERG